MTSKILNVDLAERSYEIIIGSKILDQAGEYLKEILKNPRTVIITDENVAIHQLPRLEKSLKAENIDFETIVLPVGETTKSFSQYEDLLDKLLEMRLERSDMIIALGGGVIGDLVGFVASSYQRGINFIQIPTSLLAQVDSSVGGKTGINSPRGKNLIGAFHQPKLVLIDVTTLNTLQPRHILAGYAEVVKYGLIDDPEFFDFLDENAEAIIAGDEALRTEIIYKSCSAKAKIVSEDEKEMGRRALLNLGHTFGHALEAEVGYGDDLYHGEAVAIGMEIAFEVSEILGFCSVEDCEKVKAHHRKVGLKPASDFKFDADVLIDHMQGDKKMSGGELTFILNKGIGQSFLYKGVDNKDLKIVLDRFFK